MRATGLMPYRLPRHDANGKLIDPHVVILGAGASKAVCTTDANGKIVPLLKDIHKVLDLDFELFDQIKPNEIEDFEAFYSDLVETGKADLAEYLERAVFDYFFSLKLPDEPTIYDYLILSLTEKDTIISFNWDPFLLHSYHRNLSVGNLPKLCFPHGNTAVGVCFNCHQKGYYGTRCAKCKKVFLPSKLLFPVKMKDYSSLEIKYEWNCAKEALSQAVALTIFGYSAPITDKEAKDTLLEYFSKSHIEEIAPFTVIDIKSDQDLKENWKDFFEEERQRMLRISKDFFETDLFSRPRNSCETIFAAILQQSPLGNIKSFKKFKTLEELQEFAKGIEIRSWV